ncbi:carboxymuconolactone decarboxylase family protein [Frankia sp. CNm7]|uniref:Carboxymuconolactone decarboxylase family protein n=1 Tax=Frankia nepalensis TaxID=1836974 RepID=A0A937UST4_9ACTN|nr:carboxymuconolactone decarboxylase family protein [Frankia nepalensis]MBL7502727.1 carboxymuconolactone decarboxylase family protein [Frankia nepalensis]MBL7515111.1 carboxymuconolactone decarboxylase family protein [Frankia nepalensis]MBL7521289.1 carboxymuconolactone decarboxylase family protein [Frankia nepalensis]MBL7629236.1 carboxymuconolactone decarboxylase family protein [Frankia nepalensis]
MGDAEQTYREVMTREPTPATTPYEAATRDFVFGEVWSRPGLSRRDRRWVALTCVAAADSPEPIDDHVYAALKSGDISLPEMLEFILHFAVYCGWPKASHVEMVIAKQSARISQENGQEPEPWPTLANETLGDNDWESRLERGVKEFVEVNLTPAPPATSPYRHAGILSFVFGHVWQRPGLTRRERRIITVACVAIDDSPTPLTTHVSSALHSGDLTKEEMDEIVLQFATYYGFAKGEALHDAAEAAWAKKSA